MSIMVSLMLSGVMAATPTTPLPWFQLEDYPMWAVNRRAEGVTAFELLVDPRGRPAACAVLQSSGFETLDRQTCSIASNRARFAPALNPEGQPTYGVYRSKVSWSLDPEKWAQLEAGPDVEINLSKLPDDATQPIDVKFAYLLDATGHAQACTAVGPAHPKVLDELGCRQVTAQAQRAASAANVANAAVVQTIWIRFAPTQ